MANQERKEVEGRERWEERAGKEEKKKRKAVPNSITVSLQLH